MTLKSFLSLLAAACLIVLFAFLPQIVASRLDMATDDQMMFASVSEVQLEFSQSDISIEQTIAIAGHMKNTVEIPEDLATLKKGKVEAIAAATAKRYHQAGVLLRETDDFQLLQCQSLLCYGLNNQTNIFWKLHYGTKDSGSQFIMLVDDRTGTICSLEYTDAEEAYSPEDMEFILFNFSELYLSSLGEFFYNFKTEDIVMQAKTAEDKSYLASEITWEDEIYSDCKITFFVNRNGFYTYLY